MAKRNKRVEDMPVINEIEVKVEIKKEEKKAPVVKGARTIVNTRG